MSFPSELTSSGNPSGGGISSAVTVSTTTPTDTSLPWFNPSDGSLAFANGATWVVVSGATRELSSYTLSGASDAGLTSPSDGDVIKYDSATSKWVHTRLKFNVALVVEGKPSAGGKLFFKPAETFTLPSGLTGTIVEADTAATASAVFTIKKGAATVGTLTFAAAGTVPTVNFSSAVTYTGDTDKFYLEFPTVQDATLANISLNFIGDL